MAVKFQVFISSTYEDLKDEREQVVKAVLEMGHIPVGMEMFSAADEEQWKIIARHIDESDYYVVVLAHRYGHMTPEGISYTRKEYEYAVKQGVPVLAEPPRECCRLRSLRGWSHVRPVEALPAGVAGAGCADGVRASARVPVAVEGDLHDQ